MKTHVAMMMVIGILGGCAKHSSPTVIEMTPAEVGTKTPDYEVVGANELKLASGVKVQILEGAGGQNNGFVVVKRDGGLGGFMACGCVGATTSSCITVNDNPQHASCSGSCTDSEGNAHPCQLEGPIIGPPRDPFFIKFVDRIQIQPPENL